MDFNTGERGELFRREVREFFAEHLTDEVRQRVRETGTVHDWKLHRALGEKGWLAASWPVEYGGQEREASEMAAFYEEAALAGAPFDGLLTTLIIANTIRHVGTDEQKREIIPPILRGEVLVALGYSEPGSGSDVASVRMRAVRDGDEWVIDGEKVFTTLAHESQYVILLTRTDPEVSKHAGLTMFLVPLDLPGIEIRPIHTLGGERTNSTFYAGVRVHDRWRVGEVNGGWDVMGVALTFERTVTGGKETVRLLERFVEWAREATDADGRPRLEEAPVREAIARTAIRNEVSYLLAQRANWVAASGGLPGVEGSQSRLFYTTRFQRTASELMDVIGPEAVLDHNAEGAPASGHIEHAHRHSQVGTIYGGTSEIQRGIIARRGLKLPSAR